MGLSELFYFVIQYLRLGMIACILFLLVPCYIEKREIIQGMKFQR
jgi:hypothetical protein